MEKFSESKHAPNVLFVFNDYTIKSVYYYLILVKQTQILALYTRKRCRNIRSGKENFVRVRI